MCNKTVNKSVFYIPIDFTCHLQLYSTKYMKMVRCLIEHVECSIIVPTGTFIYCWIGPN